MMILPKTLKRLERIAFCGEGYHKIINMGLHTYENGNPDPELTWKIAYDDRCDRCKLRFDAALKAYKMGLMMGKNS